MSLPTSSLVTLTSGLIVAVGVSGGCQAQRNFRLPSTRLMPNWRSVESRTSNTDRPSQSEFYTPEQEDDSQPQLRLPPEPDVPMPSAQPERPLPVPPAAEPESPPQARRWLPSRSGSNGKSPERFSASNDSDDLNYPPARVTYNASEESAEDPAITPAPEHSSSSQPRLFRPAGTAKNTFDSMRRKLSRPDATK